jgi:hypothetical protein
MVNHQWRPVARESLMYVGRGAPRDIENDGGRKLSCHATRPATLAPGSASSGRRPAPRPR